MIRSFIIFLLQILARAILKKYRPIVVVIAGSVGKTSSKEAIAVVLEKHFRIRKTERNLNTEYSVPLAIIGTASLPTVLSAVIALRGVFLALRQLVIRNHNYPKVLILELGVLGPGDIRYFTRWLKPEIAVVSAMGEIPAHVEYYAGPEEVAREDSWIVRKLSKNSIAVLNRDDPAVWEMRALTKARVMSFGFAEEAHARIAEYRIDFPDGISFKLFADGSFVPIRIRGCLGKPHTYAAAAATAVGLTMGLNLVEIANALLSYQAPPGRMKLLPGIKDTWIIDDTYNASPVAMHASLEAVGALAVKRKIAVLGAMAETGKFMREAHEAAGFLAAEIADIIITVGDTAKIIGESAKSKNFSAESLLHFDSAKEAGKFLQQIIVPGDAVLVKGSRALKMEQVVEEIAANPSIR